MVVIVRICATELIFFKEIYVWPIFGKIDVLRNEWRGWWALSTETALSPRGKSTSIQREIVNFFSQNSSKKSRRNFCHMFGSLLVNYNMEKSARCLLVLSSVLFLVFSVILVIVSFVFLWVCLPKKMVLVTWISRRSSLKLLSPH